MSKKWKEFLTKEFGEDEARREIELVSSCLGTVKDAKRLFSYPPSKETQERFEALAEKAASTGHLIPIFDPVKINESDK